MRKTITIAALFLATAAYGHSWYPTYCCSGDSMSGDCQQIPFKAVEIVPGGFQVTLHAGQHRKITKPHVYFVKQETAKPSKDGEYHLCLYPSEDKVQCFFSPDFGV